MQPDLFSKYKKGDVVKYTDTVYDVANVEYTEERRVMHVTTVSANHSAPGEHMLYGHDEEGADCSVYEARCKKACAKVRALFWERWTAHKKMKGGAV